MWIAREAENLIMQYAKEFSAVIVTGVRQAGKTSILTRLFPQAEYVSLDNPLKALQAENSPQEFLASLGNPAIIDEIQYAPSLFRYLKLFIDREKQKGMYLLTGSQQFSLMQNVAESLAGRCGVINLSTLSASEIDGSHKNIPMESLILKGGYPELWAGEGIQPAHWFSSYLATYLERDIRNVLRVMNLRDFNLFLKALALRTAQTLSLSDLARDIGTAPNTIKAWLSVLEASGQIYLLQPYYRNAGKRLVKSPKIYFRDIGLVVYLMGLNSWKEIRESFYAGAIWENFIFTQIYKKLSNSGESAINLWFWRTNIGDEVDFVIEKGGRFTAIECKLTETPTEKDLKGLNSLKKYYGESSIKDAYLACKVSEDFKMNSGITVSNFRKIDFL